MAAEACELARRIGYVQEGPVILGEVDDLTDDHITDPNIVRQDLRAIMAKAQRNDVMPSELLSEVENHCPDHYEKLPL